jgi:hypothetical protein
MPEIYFEFLAICSYLTVLNNWKLAKNKGELNATTRISCEARASKRPPGYQE